MTDKEKPDQSLENLAKFAKMVKKQLKKAYNKDVRRVGKKVDKHDQPKALLKIGSGDDAFELWFRNASDGAIVIDKIGNGVAAGTLKINTPICHLRTSALLVDKFDIPNRPDADGAMTPPDRTEGGEDTWSLKEGAVKQAANEVVDEIAKLTGEEWERLQSHLFDDPRSFVDEYKDRLPEELRQKLIAIVGIREEKEIEEPAGEPEDFEEDFTAPSNKFAIVDASVIEGLDNELAEQAIIVPVKYPGAIFEVIAAYDDTILRNLTISPSEVQEGDTDVVKTTEFTTAEGIAPLSHDSSPERAVRKTIKQIHHQAGGDKLRIKDPTKKAVIKRDQSQKDKRKKSREAQREDIYKKDMIKALLEDCSAADRFSASDLEFAKRVIKQLKSFESLAKAADNAISGIDGILPSKKKTEAKELLEFVEWIQKEQKTLRKKMMVS